MESTKKKLKIAVAITGASGAIYAKVLLQQLQMLQDQWSHVGLVWSKNAKDVWRYELPNEDIPTGFIEWMPHDYTAPIASGSAGFDALIICPCSMGTLGRISAGISDNLTTRAADVMLKEKKKLVLVPREAPYNEIHLRNMLALQQAGAIICPASPSFYSMPQSSEDIAATITTRVLQLAGFKVEGYRWGKV